MALTTDMAILNKTLPGTLARNPSYSNVLTTLIEKGESNTKNGRQKFKLHEMTCREIYEKLYLEYTDPTVKIDVTKLDDTEKYTTIEAHKLEKGEMFFNIFEVIIDGKIVAPMNFEAFAIAQAERKEDEEPMEEDKTVDETPDQPVVEEENKNDEGKVLTMNDKIKEAIETHINKKVDIEVVIKELTVVKARENEEEVPVITITNEYFNLFVKKDRAILKNIENKKIYAITKKEIREFNTGEYILEALSVESWLGKKCIEAEQDASALVIELLAENEISDFAKGYNVKLIKFTPEQFFEYINDFTGEVNKENELLKELLDEDTELINKYKEENPNWEQEEIILDKEVFLKDNKEKAFMVLSVSHKTHTTFRLTEWIRADGTVSDFREMVKYVNDTCGIPPIEIEEKDSQEEKANNALKDWVSIFA